MGRTWERTQIIIKSMEQLAKYANMCCCTTSNTLAGESGEGIIRGEVESTSFEGCDIGKTVTVRRRDFTLPQHPTQRSETLESKL